MRAGKLDKVLTVETLVSGRTPKGDVTTDEWHHAKDMYCETPSMKLVERYISAQVVAEMETAFRLREWPPSLTPAEPATQRIVYNGRPFKLWGVVDMGRGLGVLAVCMARAEGESEDQAAGRLE